MIKYIAKRLLQLIPKLLIISLIIFLGLQILPGDAITRTISPDVYKFMTPEQMEELREALGLNKPLYVQYFTWLKGILHGDFGYSQASGSDIASMMASRLPSTIELTFIGLIVANILGLLFGYIAALNKNTFIDYLFTALSVIGISVPEFFFGIAMIMLFSLKLKILPTGGRMAAGKPDFVDRIPYMIMPVFGIGISYIATLMRFTRSSMLDVLNKDYIKTARSKGLNETEVNVKHGFRNALIPVMTLLVFRLPILVSGTVVIESIFNYPGMGSLVLDAISAGDMPVVMITTMVISVVTLLASTLVDVLTALLDPRIRLE